MRIWLCVECGERVVYLWDSSLLKHEIRNRPKNWPCGHAAELVEEIPAKACKSH